MFLKGVKALQGAADVVQHLPFSPLHWRAVLRLTAGDLSPLFSHLKEPTAWIGGVLSPWPQVWACCSRILNAWPQELQRRKSSGLWRMCLPSRVLLFIQAFLWNCASHFPCMVLILVFSGASRLLQQRGAADSSSSRNYSSATFVPGAAPAEVQKVIASETKTRHKGDAFLGARRQCFLGFISLGLMKCYWIIGDQFSRETRSGWCCSFNGAATFRGLWPKQRCGLWHLHGQDFWEVHRSGTALWHPTQLQSCFLH